MGAREQAHERLDRRRKGSNWQAAAQADGLRGIGYAILALSDAVVGSAAALVAELEQHRADVALVVDPHPGVPDDDGRVVGVAGGLSCEWCHGYPTPCLNHEPKPVVSEHDCTTCCPNCLLSEATCCKGGDQGPES